MTDIVAIYIISSNGSLIFDYHSQPSKLNADKNIVLASLFYACYANSEQIGLGLVGGGGDPNFLTPQSLGIKTLEAENFRLDCFETLTKVKFVIISDLSLGTLQGTANKHELLKRIYELYADFVMKNPFYTLNMPINSDNCSLFKSNLEQSLTSGSSLKSTVGSSYHQ